MAITVAQLSRQPIYIQREIEVLQRRVAELTKERDEIRQAYYGGDTDSPVSLRDYARGDVNLPSDARIRFSLSDRTDDYAEAWMVERPSGKRLVQVRTGWSALIFQPQAGNAAAIGTARD